MFRFTVIAGLVAYAVAQSISAQCEATVATILADPGASQCLALPDFINVVTAGDNTSLVAPINTWLTSLCSDPACNNATLSGVLTNLSTGCSAELGAITNVSLTTLTTEVEALYPTVRKVVCLTHGSTLCITETLTDVETVTGPLSLDNIVNIIQNPPSSLPSNIICTDCNKETYNIWAQAFPSASAVASAKTALESQCNASFVDGASPADISESASTSIIPGSVASKQSPAFSLLDTLTNSVAVAVGVSSFITLSTVYTLLI